MRKNSILWADDDVDDLQMMREILQKSDIDFDIIEVRNGKEALQHLQIARDNASLPCLIILDINMPVMDGKETLSIIKQNRELKDIPVVIFTTSQSEMDKLFCERLGSEMITKPPTFKKLEDTVTRLLSFCKWK
jgi:CheY-like chemotaxis protein